ncbi:amino acid racemase [Romeria aff. gracilis LEGE 07310]|uniref:Amino acid racemase n=1 Tax=Vasconcelosia minhoensis LEGE 07310 TaxID=915328 RepID=A0A8J7AIR4_9CYAN|nr:amino acid racemase [Romeria gracilis]MBE9079826.1 amino acid racemase [Romeria aff. gracilis LEGE 07310]
MTHNSPSRFKQQINLPGILGGLGPLAHIEFEQRLLQQSLRRGARRDQEHPNWLLVSAASTPDRSRYLLETGSDCVPALVRSARLLESMGASFLVVTCNTAHAFYLSVQSQLSIPWLNMMDATANYIAQHFPQVKRVGVLATDGTVRARLYATSLTQYELSPIIPSLDSPIQRRIMQSIYDPDWGVKASGIWVSDIALTELADAVCWLTNQGAELVVAGCTEISIALAKQNQLPINWIDPLDIMANLTLDLAYENHPASCVVLA